MSPGPERMLPQEMTGPREEMISRAPREQRGRRRRLGVAGSLAVHVLCALLFVLLAPLFPTPEVETQSSSPEVVTITHRPKTRATAPPQPRVRPATQPVHAPVAVLPPRPHAERSRARPAVAPRVAPVPAVRPKREPRAARAAPATAPPTAPEAAALAHPGATRSTYSKAAIDRIENDLAQSIAQDRGGITPLAVGSSEPTPGMKRYGPAIAAFDVGDERTHHGLCDPIKSWDSDGFDYYYVACNVRFSDGTMQRESVPWPVRFVPNDDPFSGTAGKDLPLAMPLPGWHLQPGAYISKELREYVRDHGISI